MSSSPKVFISHSGGDKQRFVLKFAERLRNNGIAAWLDVWEMLPGDSLVEKIWNEGLKGSDAVIVVLSNHSVGSKWVLEELNTAMVKKILDKTKLIPVRLESCEVPECVRSTVWVDIPDLENYEPQFERVVNAVFGQLDKPPVGPPPRYIRDHGIEIGGLAPVDTVIFDALCRKTVETGFALIDDIEPVVADLYERGISEHQFVETQQILEGRKYVRLHPTGGPQHPYSMTVTPYGFDQFAKTAIPEFQKLVAEVGRRLVRAEQMENAELAIALGQPRRIVDHVLEIFESKGWVELGRQIGGGYESITVDSVSPELRRTFERIG